MNSTHLKTRTFVGAVALLALGTGVACSAGHDGSQRPALAENTGGIALKLSSVPSDVQCVEIDTSDGRVCT